MAVVKRIGTQPARGAEIVLLAGEGDAGKTVHDIAIGVPAQPDVEDEVAAGLGMAGVPEPLHPGGIAAHDMVEGGGQLMPDEIVLFGEHVLPPFQALLSAPPEISTNIGLALVEISHFSCRCR